MSELTAPAEGLKRGLPRMALDTVSLRYPSVDAEITNNPGDHETHESVRTSNRCSRQRGDSASKGAIQILLRLTT